MTYLKSLWDRVTIHWHVLAAALVAAAPEILNYLGVIDLRPILSHFLPDDKVDFIISALPFVLVFLKPMLAVEASEAD